MEKLIKKYALAKIIGDDLDGGDSGSVGTYYDESEYYLEKDKFTSNNCGKRNVQRINLRTGKGYVAQYVHSVSGNRLPLNLTLTYNPAFATQNKLNGENVTGVTQGKLAFNGWKFNYQQYVIKKNGAYYYYDENFTSHKFILAQNSTTEYYDSTGQTGLILTEKFNESDSTQNCIEISDNKQLTYRFNVNGELVSVIHKAGTLSSMLTLSYSTDGQISQIVDGAGRVFTFDYSTASSVKIKQTLSDNSQQSVAELKFDNLNYLTELFYWLELHSVKFSYSEDHKMLSTVINECENEKSEFTVDNLGVFSEISNYKYINGGYQLKNTLTFTALNSHKTTFQNTVNVNESLEITDKTFYYFADNGELIYALTEEESETGSTEQTLAEKADAFLTATTFSSAKEFEYYNVVLSQNPIAKFTFGGEDNPQKSVTVASYGSATSNVLNLPKLSEKKEYCLFAVNVKTDQTLTENRKIQVVLKENGEQKAIVSLTNRLIKYALIPIASGEHNYTVEVNNATTSQATVETSLYYLPATKEKEVINVNNGNEEILQIVKNGRISWYERKNCTILLNDVEIASNVEFTYRDYILTLNGYFKNKECFTLWYNDCKNAITNCSICALNFIFNNEEKILLTCFKYAKMQSLANESVFNSISISFNYIKFKSEYFRNNEYLISYSLINNNYQTVKAKDENNVITEYTYDDYGNCLNQKIYPQNEEDLVLTYDTEYFNNDLIKSKKEYYGTETLTTSYTYDDYGRLITVTMPNGQVITYSEPFGDGDYIMQTNFTNANNEVKQLVNRQNYSKSTLQLVDSSIPPEVGPAETLPITFEYDKFGEVKIAKIDNVCSLYNVKTVYDSNKNGHVEVIYGTEDNKERYYFDKYGHVNKLTQFINGNEECKYLFIYSDEPINGIVTELSDSRIKLSKNSLLRQIVDKELPNNYNKLYYDAGRNLMGIETFALNSYVLKDELGRVNQEHNFTKFNNGNPLIDCSRTFNYSNVKPSEIESEVAEIKTAEETKQLTTTYEKDSLGRITSVIVMGADNNGYKQTFVYKPRQKKILVKPGTGSGITIVDGNGNVLPPATTEDIGATNYLSAFKEYKIRNGVTTIDSNEKIELDANGNITKYGNNTYVYDKVNRLIRENNNDLGKTIVYTYDTHGNITSRVEYSYTTASNLSTLTPTKTDTFSYNVGWKDQLKSINNGSTITYDYAGNPLSYKGKTFEWDGRFLTKVTKNGNEYSFVYDEKNRISKKSYVKNSRQTQEINYYDGNNLSCTITYVNGSSYTNIVSYSYNSQGVAGINNGSLYTFRKNLFGDITEIYKGTNCVAKYNYDAWGNCTVCNPDGTVNTAEDFIGNVNPFRYRGYYWDKHAEMYFLQTRWYDPSVCRFISPDSHEYLDPASFGGLNLYSYCYNNPIMYADPSGHLPEWAWKLIIGTSFILVGALVTAATAGAGAAFWAAFGSALLTSTIQVGISTAVSAGLGFISGGLSTGTWEGAFTRMLNGAVDGYMWGGIISGGSQILSGLMKVGNGISAGRVDALYKSENSTTLFNYNNAAGKSRFRIDVAKGKVRYPGGKTSFLSGKELNGLHYHFGKSKSLRDLHRFFTPGIVNGFIASGLGYFF